MVKSLNWSIFDHLVVPSPKDHHHLHNLTMSEDLCSHLFLEYHFHWLIAAFQFPNILYSVAPKLTTQQTWIPPAKASYSNCIKGTGLIWS